MMLSPRFARASTAALVLSGWLLSPAAARTEPAQPPTSAAGVARIRIDNFGRVNETFYRGAQPRGGDYADLASLGVRTVINLTSDDADAEEQAMTERAGMRYVEIPMSTRVVPTKAQLSEFLAIVNDPASQPVYVHCVGGRHRTGVMTAGYRMVHDGWSADRAFQEMKQYKFGADFLHPEFKKFVYAFRSEPRPATPTNTVLATTVVN